MVFQKSKFIIGIVGVVSIFLPFFSAYAVNDTSLNTKEMREAVLESQVAQEYERFRKFTEENKQYEQAVTYCSCQIRFNDHEDLFSFFKDETRTLFTQTGKVVLTVDLSKKTCGTITTDNEYDPFFNFKGCVRKERSACCCQKEEGEYSTRYFNCKQAPLTVESAGSLCQGVLGFDESKGFCEAEVIQKKKDAPKDGKSDVTIDLATLREKAKELDVVKASPQQLIKRAINGLMAFMGSILFALYIYAGFTWMLANGNDEKITQAKNILVWSTLGVAVMMGSYVIISFIFTTLAP